MLDPRRPTSVSPNEPGNLLAEAALIGGTIAAFYLAAYLYEIGFLWRFGLPVSLAEIGFSRTLAIVAVAAPAGAFMIGCVLCVRAFATGNGTIAGNAAHSALALGSAAACMLALVADAARQHYLDTALAGYGDLDGSVLKALVFLAGIISVALYQGHAARLLARAQAGRMAGWSLLILLLIALPVRLGWRGAGLKEARPSSFLYLAGSDFALVRLYTDKAVFLRFDPADAKFGSEYRVHHFDAGQVASVARRLETR